MNQINIFKAKQFFSNYWREIVIIILAVILFQQCTGKTALEQSAKDHERNAKEYLSKISVLKKELRDREAVYQIKIKAKDQEIKRYEKSITGIQKNLRSKLGDIRHYNSKDIAKYFISRYNAGKGVKQLPLGVELRDTVGRKVVADLVTGESCQFENKELRKIALSQTQKFEIASANIDSLHFTINDMVKNYDGANAEKDKANSDLKKALRKSNVKGGIFRYVCYGLAGFLIYEKAK